MATISPMPAARLMSLQTPEGARVRLLYEVALHPFGTVPAGSTGTVQGWPHAQGVAALIRLDYRLPFLDAWHNVLEVRDAAPIDPYGPCVLSDFEVLSDSEPKESSATVHYLVDYIRR